MDGPTSPAALPEWHAFLEAFPVRFWRPEGREALERCTPGLRTELSTKNGDETAQAVPGTGAQRLPSDRGTRRDSLPRGQCACESAPPRCGGG
jgi:hypothetical protein